MDSDLTHVPEPRRLLVRDYIMTNLIHAYSGIKSIPYGLIGVAEPDDNTTVVLVGRQPVFIAWDVHSDEPSAAGRVLLGEPSPELTQALGLADEDA